jgi:pyruvate/2-oxoglutarate dehydrogenase complex dihydrolipoamide dehydrogenase (E3) component
MRPQSASISFFPTRLLFLSFSTHYAGYQGAIAARNILLPFTDPGVLPNVPSTIFTSPEVATIGLSEKEALQQYGSSKVVVYRRNLSHVDRAICDNAQEGLIKIICHKNLQILGATIVAPVAGEMISEIAVMMKAKMSFDKLATVMHPYPVSEYSNHGQ